MTRDPFGFGRAINFGRLDELTPDELRRLAGALGIREDDDQFPDPEPDPQEDYEPSPYDGTYSEE